MSTESQPDMNKLLFLNLIMMLGTTAMQQLGKIIDPTTGKTEVDLQSAQATIDLIVMLKEKTKGNRDTEEERILTDTLSSLQLNFVETAQSDKDKPAKEETEAPNPEQAEESPAETEQSLTEEPPEVEPVDDPASNRDSNEPKFHKSYG